MGLKRNKLWGGRGTSAFCMLAGEQKRELQKAGLGREGRQPSSHGSQCCFRQLLLTPQEKRGKGPLYLLRAGLLPLKIQTNSAGLVSDQPLSWLVRPQEKHPLPKLASGSCRRKHGTVQTFGTAKVTKAADNDRCVPGPTGTSIRTWAAFLPKGLGEAWG